MAYAPSKDSDQPGHPPSLIRVFAVRLKKHWVLSYPLSTQPRLIGSDKADLSLRWAHMPFCWFSQKAAHFDYKNRTLLILLVFTLISLENDALKFFIFVIPSMSFSKYRKNSFRLYKCFIYQLIYISL